MIGMSVTESAAPLSKRRVEFLAQFSNSLSVYYHASTNENVSD